MSQEEVDAAIARNVEKVMNDPREPRLRFDLETPVIARDRRHGWVLLGGLGAFGMGRMWFRDTGQYEAYLGYDDAPEQDSTGGFGT